MCIGDMEHSICIFHTAIYIYTYVHVNIHKHTYKDVFVPFRMLISYCFHTEHYTLYTLYRALIPVSYNNLLVCQHPLYSHT